MPGSSTSSPCSARTSLLPASTAPSTTTASSKSPFSTQIFLLINLPSTTLPTGYQLQLQLNDDASNKIVGVRWIVNDLGVLPSPTTRLTGYWLVDPRANLNAQYSTEQHINYIGVDGHVHERLHFASGDWS